MIWDGSLSKCEPKCDLVETINNGIVNCSDSNRLGSKCSFSCFGNYQLSSQEPSLEKQLSIRCEIDDIKAKWSSQVPTCLPICQELDEAISNGNITCSGFHEGDSCNIKCDRDYNLNGPSQLKCI